MSIYQSLIERLIEQRANYLVLIDPDRKNDGLLEKLVTNVNASGADALLVGGSLIMDGSFDERVAKIKAMSQVPVILFPGSSNQLTRQADAVLFMSLLSGRNPQYLIGEQVQAAPVVKHLGLEVIPTGYLLMAGGSPTAVEFMSSTQPLPMNKPDIVIAHALAAQYLGMSLVYLEAGSGARQAVPDDIISKVTKVVDVPVVVGGGIRTPEGAAAKVRAGAQFVVTGTILEEDGSPATLRALADAVHQG
ncbi:MAG: geranylgeranylglyceryl/heptaprenylglyceryl phosphate synthase [Fidelibacterota bacterium]|nr:MAG: geranylgeranylglyceryl/heptaprenylglyceryl phosphate synthase [Candidatus Neomarinimicrobiota bacterium]